MQHTADQTEAVVREELLWVDVLEGGVTKKGLELSMLLLLQEDLLQLLFGLPGAVFSHSPQFQPLSY